MYEVVRTGTLKKSGVSIIEMTGKEGHRKVNKICKLYKRGSLEETELMALKIKEALNLFCKP